MKTREQKVAQMIASDMEDIIQAWHNNDTEFFHAVLSGEGWIPYNQCTNEEIDRDYDAREFEESDDEEV